MLDWQQHLTELTLLDASTSDSGIPVQYTEACAPMDASIAIACCAIGSNYGNLYDVFRSSFIT